MLALSRFRVKSGLEGEAEHAFLGHLRRVGEAPGFMALEVFRDSDDPCRLLVLMRWSDAASFRTWNGGFGHEGSHTVVPPGMSDDPQDFELVLAERVEGAASGGAAGELLVDCAPTFAHLVREGSAVPVAVLDAGGTIEWSNAALDQLAGRAVKGVAFERLLVDTSVAAFREAREAAGARGFVFVHLMGPDGPTSLRCLIAPSGAGGHVVVGDGSLDEERALARNLQGLNADLARLTRESLRQAAENERIHRELHEAHWHIKKIAEVLPMCLECRRVKTGRDAWESVATFLAQNSAFVSHGYCAACAARLDAEDAGS